MAVMTGIYLLYLFIPILLLFVGSFGEAWTNTLLPTGLTGAWYLELWQDGSFRRAFTVSLEVVVATCVFCTLLAVPLAYALYRSASRGVMVAARIVFLLPIAAPPLVLAFGFILIFSTDALPWLGSIWLLIAGHVVLTLPYLLQTLVADMRHLRLEELELAAESLGATFRERFMDVVVPLLRHSLGSGLIMVAALFIGVPDTITSPLPIPLASPSLMRASPSSAVTFSTTISSPSCSWLYAPTTKPLSNVSSSSAISSLPVGDAPPSIIDVISPPSRNGMPNQTTIAMRSRDQRLRSFFTDANRKLMITRAAPCPSAAGTASRGWGCAGSSR